MEKLEKPDIILNMVKIIGNDFELGREYRKFISSFNDGLDEYCIKYPNDIKLGGFLRNEYKGVV